MCIYINCLGVYTIVIYTTIPAHEGYRLYINYDMDHECDNNSRLTTITTLIVLT